MRYKFLLSFFSLSSAFALALSPERPLQYGFLKAKEVNFRKGPLLDHPITWVYRCYGWPVVIEKTTDKGYWSLVRDIDGTQGWVKSSLIGLKPTVCITCEKATLYRKQEDNQQIVDNIVAYLEKRVIAKFIKWDPSKKWGYVKIEKKHGQGKAYEGWLLKETFWPWP